MLPLISKVFTVSYNKENFCHRYLKYLPYHETKPSTAIDNLKY